MDKAITGRVLLIKYAVRECLATLESALKYRSMMQSAEKQKEFSDWIEGRTKFCLANTGGEAEKVVITPELEQEYAETNPLPFPSWTECNDTYARLTFLAVVLFAQAFNQGDGDADKAARSHDPEVKKFREHVLNNAFSDDEKESFSNLKKQLLTACNKMIGHADGKAFDVIHGEDMRSHKGYRAILSEIDLDEWLILQGKYLSSVNDIAYHYV